MKTMKLSMFFIALTMMVQAWAISPELKSVATFETRSNAVAKRSNQQMVIENFEIPLALIQQDVASRIDPGILQSLIFMKNGQKYIRWIINPEDTKWHKEVRKLLRENGLSAARHQYFEAYQTASRSYFIIDPHTGTEFSAKVSTNKTGGNWRDKKQTYEDAWQIRMVTDYVFDQIKKTGALENIILLDEPAIFGLKEIDQGMVIREYGKLAKSGHTYVPGFSIMHDETGRYLAKVNGSNNPAEFWNDHYNKPLARAIAEFAALTGMTYDSPHSQNFLVELDEKLRPTGKIVFRDFGDTYLAKEFFDAMGKSDIPQRWEADNVVKGRLNVSVGILHGNEAPSWMDMESESSKSSSYNQWGRDFYEAFAEEFGRQTGLVLNKSTNLYRNGAYFNVNYDLKDAKGQQFLNLVKYGKQRANLGGKCNIIYKTAM